MLNGKIEEYLRSLVPAKPDFINEMEDYAKKEHVPIMEPEGMEFLLQLLRLRQPKAILELGTAIGYSAIRMAGAVPDAQIVTLERDEERIIEAKANFAKAGVAERIRLIEGDALDNVEEAGAFGPFDMIFIDAAKGQYQRFFEHYEAFLREGGVIVTDNVLFKGLVAGELDEIDTRRIRGLVKKIKNFNEWLAHHPHYDTVIVPIGDGVAISKHRGEKE
ncbi:O-methyltransferase [Bacillus massiliglaciei]|uniref:O-methyltransferase n=1 Tax=Bacillus massiliglaciei TaxID=1816693 RepID=UPI000AA0115E|nr:O-methyltransferase [Bacillus massiliglaciei]